MMNTQNFSTQNNIDSNINIIDFINKNSEDASKISTRNGTSRTPMKRLENIDSLSSQNFDLSQNVEQRRHTFIPSQGQGIEECLI